MTALIVIAVIIGVIVLLLNIPAVLYVDYKGGKADIRLRYLWLTLLPKKETPPRKKKKGAADEDKDNDEAAPDDAGSVTAEDKAEDSGDAAEDSDDTDSDENADNTDNTDSDKELDQKKKKDKAEKVPLHQKISDIIDGLTAKKDAFQLLWGMAFPPVKRLLKKIKVDRIDIDFAAADEDPHAAALLYGKLGAALSSAVGVIKALTKIKLRSVKVDCLFNTPKEQTRYDASCRVTLRPASLLNAIFALVFRFLGGFKKYSAALNTLTGKE